MASSPEISPELRSRFESMLGLYPARRCAVVPMLLYAQDELGFVTPEAISAIAKMAGEPEISVREVIGYYSMLRLEPVGRFHVQVCTNISCQLRGGDELFEHCRHRLGIGHKQTAPDGIFSLEEVECIGACSWAPAIQINYDFHENLTPAQLDSILDGYHARGVAEAEAETAAEDMASEGPAPGGSSETSWETPPLPASEGRPQSDQRERHINKRTQAPEPEVGD